MQMLEKSQKHRQCVQAYITKSVVVCRMVGRVVADCRRLVTEALNIDFSKTQKSPLIERCYLGNFDRHLADH